MAKRKRLPVLESGKRYEGWMGFCDDEPGFSCERFKDGASELFASKRAARRVYEDVRRVTITVEE